MPPPKLRAIIFDIGRVLVRIDVARAMQGLSSGAPSLPPNSGRLSKRIPGGPTGKKAEWLHATGIFI